MTLDHVDGDVYVRRPRAQKTTCPTEGVAKAFVCTVCFGVRVRKVYGPIATWIPTRTQTHGDSTT